METLQNQSPRDYKHVTKNAAIDLISEINEVAKESKLSFDQVFKIYELKEKQRTNSLYVANGDAHDEQLAGFGDLVSELSSNLEEIANSLGKS